MRGSAGEQSAQYHRDGRDVARSNVDEYSRVTDVIERSEYGAGDRASRAESTSFSMRHDMLNDPDFMQQVARRNGMSAMRFYSQETPTIMRQAQDYAAEKGIVAAAVRLNNTTFAGETMPATKAELYQQAEQDRSEIAHDIDKIHTKKRLQTGFSGTAALQISTDLPEAGSDARRSVENNLNPNNITSIPARVGAFNENVEAWASHDKKIGEGRANPMAVVEGMEARDIMDVGKKILDKLIGGDGTADGEKLNDNKKREDNAGF